MAKTNHSPDSQRQKFEALARELECDEDEAAFDERLKRLATAPGPKDSGKPKKPKPD